MALIVVLAIGLPLGVLTVVVGVAIAAVYTLGQTNNNPRFVGSAVAPRVAAPRTPVPPAAPQPDWIPPWPEQPAHPVQPVPPFVPWPVQPDLRRPIDPPAARPNTPAAKPPAPRPKPKPVVVPPPGPDPAVTAVRTVPLRANDLVYDPAHGRLYAAVGSEAAEHPNSVTAIDPASGEVLWSVDAGSDPAVLALSPDSSALWVGLRGAAGMCRVDVAKRTAGPLVPFGPDRFHGAVFAEKLVVLPGTADAVAASLYCKGVSPRHAGVAVYDDGVRRPAQTPGHTGANRIATTDDPGVLYGYNNETTEFGLRAIDVTDDGVSVRKVYAGAVQGFYADITFAAGRVYATTGAVVDAETGTLVGTLPASGPVAVVPAANRAYVLDLDAKVLVAIDLKRLSRVGTYALASSFDRGHPARSDGPGSLTAVGTVAVAFRSDKSVVVVPLTEFK